MFTRQWWRDFAYVFFNCLFGAPWSLIFFECPSLGADFLVSDECYASSISFQKRWTCLKNELGASTSPWHVPRSWGRVSLIKRNLTMAKKGDRSHEESNIELKQRKLFHQVLPSMHALRFIFLSRNTPCHLHKNWPCKYLFINLILINRTITQNWTKCNGWFCFVLYQMRHDTQFHFL